MPLSKSILVVSFLATGLLRADEPANFAARDTLPELRDDSDDAQKCLASFVWKNGKFEVRVEPRPERDESKGYDRLVRFPTPFPCGDATNDSVSMEWYQAKDAGGRVRKAPAVVVVHESGSAMPAGRAFARGLNARGWHALLMHLPYYGLRRPEGVRPELSKLIETIRQGVADVRRAHDAVAALPDVDVRHIALQGTSLGGFVSATAASLDGCYDSVYIMLAGADLFDIFENGKQDTAKIRKRLEEAGLTSEKLKELVWMVEPARVAHRLDPKTTWLYSALQDDVVPIKNARRLAECAHIDPTHHVQLVGGHYTAALYLPGIMDHITKQLESLTAK